MPQKLSMDVAFFGLDLCECEEPGVVLKQVLRDLQPAHIGQSQHKNMNLLVAQRTYLGTTSLKNLHTFVPIKRLELYICTKNY